MSAVKTYDYQQLHLEVITDEQAITVKFFGKSILRDPNEFVMPILLGILSEANESKSRVVLDFQKLDYMNSSTLTPVIKVMERARVGDGKMTLVYKQSLRWQDISFSALVIFQTKDQRIEIRGVD